MGLLFVGESTVTGISYIDAVQLGFLVIGGS